MLDLRRLRVLGEVARRGGFSAAASELHVSQSAVSQQIAALEREVGMSLLVRDRGGARPTDAGTVLLGHADAAIARLEEAERELAALAGLEAGELRMASFPTASASIVTTAAPLFRERHPAVRLRLSEGEPDESLPALKRGDHDLAVAYDFELNPFEPDRDLELTPLLTERMHAGLPRGHALASRRALRLEELAVEPWLCGTTNGSCRELTLRSCRLAGFEPRVAFESNDYNVMQSMIAAGMGVTLLPDLALEARHPGIEVVEIAPVAPVRRVWAVTRAGGSRSAAAEAMLGTLAEAAGRSGAGPRR